MAFSDQQLTSDHQKVIDTIRRYSNIALIGTVGEPVDEYDIEYTIRGYCHSIDGDIKIKTSHRVKIKLPFGYPHFPPTIRPLNALFHPDIDSNIVRIADYWESNRSLADLVVYLGEMICGKVYSTDNPFNRKAAAYYLKNINNLPLDSLKLVKDSEEQKGEKPSIDFHFPLLKIFLSLCMIAIIGSGGLFFLEKQRLESIETIFAGALLDAEDQEYEKAKETALLAKDKLQKFYMLRSAAATLQKRIYSFLQSQLLLEGLQGKVLFQGEYTDIALVHKLEILTPLITKAEEAFADGNNNEAINFYERALEYANQEQISSQIEPLRRNLAELKLQQLVALSEKAHNSKDMSWAIDAHQKVLNFIEKEKKILANQGRRQSSKTRELLSRDQISFHYQKAYQAEEDQDFETALDHYNALIDFIGKSGRQTDSTLKVTLRDAMHKAAAISTKIDVIRKQEWLIENYREIFIRYYPTAIAKTLHNPQAVFIRYEGNTMIFDLNCLEKGQASVVKLRLYYQYNPERDEWAIFEGTP